jgi:hypothetical protein
MDARRLLPQMILVMLVHDERLSEERLLYRQFSSVSDVHEERLSDVRLAR